MYPIRHHNHVTLSSIPLTEAYLTVHAFKYYQMGFNEKLWKHAHSAYSRLVTPEDRQTQDMLAVSIVYDLTSMPAARLTSHRSTTGTLPLAPLT